MGKTPDYVMKSVKKYQEKHDYIQLRFKKELHIKEKLKEKGNVNAYITNLVLKDLGIKDDIEG